MKRLRTNPSANWQLQALAPEYLLLMTIFGNRESRRRVGAELDRRAIFPPNHFRLPRPGQLQPAA
jgi:hypothetical protein